MGPSERDWTWPATGSACARVYGRPLCCGYRFCSRVHAGASVAVVFSIMLMYDSTDSCQSAFEVCCCGVIDAGLLEQFVSESDILRP
jgi:hypothetical protein